VLIVIGENRKTGQTRDEAIAALTTVGHPNFENPYGPSLPALYGLVAQRHMHEYGTTPEQLASVAVTARYHASLNPEAQMRQLITVDDVLNSRYIAEPLHLLDCCLISDAAGAIIVTSAERARDLAPKPVYVRGISEFHTHEHVSMAQSLTSTGAEVSSRAAYDMAEVSPSDFDFAMLYDCFTVVPLIEMEELGLAERGAAGEFFAGGLARVGGKLPINTHGGMLSHAHAGASGGLFDIIEASRQLRGQCGERQVDGAQLGLVHVEGGILSSHCTIVLSNTV
jgi:acetyl-CoA acetyltransferase